MTTSRCERAILVIVAQLKTITTAGGYNLNIGNSVHRARRSFDKGALPAISVWELTEAPKKPEALVLENVLSISIDMHAPANKDDTGVVMGQGRDDVKKALGSMDYAQGVRDVDGEIGQLSYLGFEPSTRTDGANTEAVSVNFQLVYHHARNDPAKQSPKSP